MKKTKLVQMLLNAPRSICSFYHPLSTDFDANKLKRHYAKQIPGFKEKDIGTIIDCFHEQIFKELLDNRNGVFLPKNIGKLYILTKDKPELGVSYISYILSIGEKIGIVAYSNDIDKKNLVDGSTWCFFLSREKMQRVRKKYKEDFMFYMNYFRINKKNNKIFDIDSKKPYIPIKENHENSIKNYNEFEM